jgi:hypothetical protein
MDQNPYESPHYPTWTDADRAPQVRAVDWELIFSIAAMLAFGVLVSLAASSVALVRLFF